MSQLVVAKVTTENNTTPLIFTTANSSSGFIKFESANDDVLIAGSFKFTGNISGNFVGYATESYAQSIGTAGNNYTITVGAAANNWANTKTSTGKAIAMAIVFG